MSERRCLYKGRADAFLVTALLSMCPGTSATSSVLSLLLITEDAEFFPPEASTEEDSPVICSSLSCLEEEETVYLENDHTDDFVQKGKGREGC